MRDITLALTLAMLLAFAPAVAAEETRPETAPPASDQSDLCTAAFQLAHLGLCPLEGPGGRAELRQRFELPALLPALKTLEPAPLFPLLTRTYAKVTTPDAPVFAKPEDSFTGKPIRTLGVGFIYVSVGKTVVLNGQEFIRINNGEYVRRADISLVQPSKFQGIQLAEQPQRPFAWVVRRFSPRLGPNGPINRSAAALNRYDVVQIFGKQRVGRYDWYLIGQDEWVEQRNLAIVEVQPPPAGVTGKWIAVNLYEQTMAVYEDERLIYASLVSSGLGQWPTRPGLFHIYSKLDTTKMSGAYAADKSDYYFLEDVPWVMYFDKSIALHGAYWHDGYGFPKSHGCVNLSPKDSRWLYEWAEVGTAVYVYDPSGQTPTVSWGGGGP